MTRKRKRKDNKTSIITRTWMYFSVFIVLALFIIWLIQNILINNFYSDMIVERVQEVGQKISYSYTNGGDYESIIEKESSESCYKIYIINEDEDIIYPLNWISEYFVSNFKESKKDRLMESLSSKQGDEQILVDDESDIFHYISSLGENIEGENEYLLIEASKKPLDSTISLMQEQFPYIAILTFLIGTIVSYFLSRKLSRPIKEINSAAKNLSSGHYDMEFPESDIEELDQLSETLNYSKEKLSKIDESRISLLANISHDLKTPITVIKSYAEMIRDITGDDKELRNENLNTIIAESNNVTEMVDSILEVTKLEYEKDQLEIEEFSLKEMTIDIIKSLDSLLIKDDYKIEITGNSQGIIHGDRSKIRKLAYNLITNAISYIGEDKKIIVDINENRKKIVYSVIDHGPGVEKELQGKIWERYYTTSSENYSRREVGTGLGLHIAKVVCDLHDFDYGVESELGQGSRFYFEIKK